MLLSLALIAAVQDPAFETVRIKSSTDGSEQQVRWYAAPGSKPAPLLVLLHTWSSNFNQKGFAETALKECADRGWHLVHPDFRGPNVRPEACGSDLAVQDVLDAVAWARKKVKVDPKRIYLSGTSGGGHMSLLMATRAPDLWAAVSAWVPVTDLAAWHGDTKKAGRKYWKNLEKVCGGPPGTSATVDAEYRKRSPLFHLARAKGLALDINTGIHDGYTGSIPVTHTLRAFNALAEANGRADRKLSEDQMNHMRTKQEIPPDLAAEREDDATRRRKVLFRRQAGPVRLTVFDGTHEGDVAAAVAWLSGKHR